MVRDSRRGSDEKSAPSLPGNQPGGEQISSQYWANYHQAKLAQWWCDLNDTKDQGTVAPGSSCDDSR